MIFVDTNVGFEGRTPYGCFVTKVSVLLDQLDQALEETDRFTRLIRRSLGLGLRLELGFDRVFEKGLGLGLE